MSRGSESKEKQTSESDIQKLQDHSGQDWRKTQRKRRSRYTAVFLLLFLGVAAVTVISVNTGNMRIS
ncbi:MAG: hypothetical protein ACI4W2_01870, partial [Eubacterium sp.]